MEIDENTVVTLKYELRENNSSGELMEVMNEKYPFEFLFGNGNLLPAFERNIKHLKSGDSFEFILSVEQAYGHPVEDNIANVPRRAFEVNGEIPQDLLQINQQVTITDDQGYNHTGKILEFDQGFVRVDFNHFMAGKALHFSGVVLSVRKATVDEIVKKHHIPSA
ncbi:MAG: FKBP-type peptidyl-prolyl cis-trans isomerase [Bacteroidota bacterium]